MRQEILVVKVSEHTQREGLKELRVGIRIVFLLRHFNVKSV